MGPKPSDSSQSVAQPKAQITDTPRKRTAGGDLRGDVQHHNGVDLRRDEYIAHNHENEGNGERTETAALSMKVVSDTAVHENDEEPKRNGVPWRRQRW